jgi:uncharacterized protein (PEP-CTERM system associated)
MTFREERSGRLTHSGHQAWGRLILLTCFGLIAPNLAVAQEGAAGRGLSVGGALEASVTATSDRRPSGSNSSDLITELRPSFFLSNRSGRVVGSVNYALSLSHHRKNFDGENVQNYLNAALSAEAIERWAYVDVAASVTQQVASAYGQQNASDSSRDNSNRIEVGTLSITPYVRGLLGSVVNYDVRLVASGTNGRRSIAADSSSVGGNVTLSSAIPGSMVGWALTANHTKQDYRAGRESTSDRYSASVSFIPDPDVTLDVRGGQESNDVAEFSRTRYDNWGAGFTWRPSPRTRAQVQFDERYFGRAYQVTIEHRMASSSIQFSSSRDAGNGAGNSATGQPITLYQLLDRQLAAQFPDPVERDLRIRAQLGTLDPGLLVGGGAINSAVTVTQRNQVLATYGGQRLSGNFQIYATRSSVVDAAASPDLTRQWGYVGNLSYRLTPTATMSLMGSRLQTQGTAGRPGTELKSATVSWTEQLARRTTASVNLRYSVFNSTTDAYREGAITAALSQRF